MTKPPEPYIQFSLENADGTLHWLEPELVGRIATRKDRIRRWKDAGSYDTLNLTEIEDGIEVDSYPGHSTLGNLRTRYVWPK